MAEWGLIFLFWDVGHGRLIALATAIQREGHKKPLLDGERTEVRG